MEQTEKVAFSQEEVEAIKVMRNKFNNAIQKIGLLLYEKKVIEREIERADRALEAFENDREALMNQLETKYGIGQLDLESGEFTPAQ